MISTCSITSMWTMSIRPATNLVQTKSARSIAFTDIHRTFRDFSWRGHSARNPPYIHQSSLSSHCPNSALRTGKHSLLSWVGSPTQRPSNNHLLPRRGSTGVMHFAVPEGTTTIEKFSNTPARQLGLWISAGAVMILVGVGVWMLRSRQR